MSFRPVDMQLAFQQVVDAGRVQASQNNQNNVAQNFFAEKLQKETDQRQEQVQKAAKVEFSKITREHEKEDQEKKQKKKKYQPLMSKTNNGLEEDKDKKTSSGFSPTLGNNLDITS